MATRFSNEIISVLKARLLRTKDNGFTFTDTEAADVARETGLTTEQLRVWVKDVHSYYVPYEHEKMSNLQKIEAFLSSTKVCFNR